MQPNSNGRIRGFLKALLPTMAMFGLQNGMMFFAAEVLIVSMLARGQFDVMHMQDFLNEYGKEVTNAGFLMMGMGGYALTGTILFYIWYKKIKKEDEAAERYVHYDSLKKYPGYLLYPGIILFALAGQLLCIYMIAVLSKA